MARLVGPKTAEHMMVSGNLVGPEEALSYGLVDALEAVFSARLRARPGDWNPVSIRSTNQHTAWNQSGRQVRLKKYCDRQ